MTTITCRCCESPAPAQPDAVLLCATCRRDPAQIRAHADALVAAAYEQAYQVLGCLTVAELQRLIVLLRTKTTTDDPAGFARRYAKTIAQGDALANYLVVKDAADQARAWRATVMAELDALNLVAT